MDRVSSLAASAAWVDGESVHVARGVAEERTADTFNEALQLAADLSAGQYGPGPWFGGLAFPGAAQWEGFPPARFIRPVEVQQLPCVTMRDAAAVPVEGEMTQAWSALVGRAMQAIGAGELEKVVLARCADATSSGAIDGWRFFEELCATAPAARHFFVRAANGDCFVGASPENLVRWRDGWVEIDALAGTAAVGGPFTEKERREHDVVVRDVVHALGPLVPVKPAQPAVMKLPTVWHLHTPVTAKADAAFDFGALLGRLFPTSAVAGAPRMRALEFIAQHEGFTRGWYAGAVGRIAPGDVDLAVALRCAWVSGRTARLFAGAGIVAGSSAQAEWDETLRKLQPAARALKQSTGVRP
jgi:isochorismate synthase